MQVQPFEIERYYERWEFTAELMLSSSDCESRPVAELLALEPDAQQRLLDLQLGYTEVAGSAELRAAIAALHERCAPGDVLTLAAAEEGIFAGYHALLGPGGHVVVETPCYGSALTLARSTGAEVSEWERRHEQRWSYDLDELERLVRSDTTLVYVNSPHNPTGSHMTPAEQQLLIEIVASSGAVLFSDEVYRGLEHDPSTRLPAACDLYERAFTLNTVSKAYGLPGLRTGWLVCRDADLLRRVREMKLYTTICSSAPSELLASVALRHSEQLIAASRALVLENLPRLEAFLDRHRELFDWVAPAAGPIGFPRIRDQRDVRAWCEAVAERHGVLMLPGDVYQRPHHVRLGYGRRRLGEALDRLERTLAG